ncbi:MAG: hypothetical protein ACREGC_02835, partial [Minisyncoccia bacterium]
VDRDGLWHINCVPIIPSDLIHKVDIVWNTAHPSFSLILNNFSIPNIESGIFYSGFDSKAILKEHMQKIGISMPRMLLIPVYQKDFDGILDRYIIKKAKEVHEKFGAPWIVKSFTSDSTMGIHLAKTFDELVAAIEDGVNHGQSIVVEEFVAGKIASVHSVPFFRENDIYTFPLGNTYGDFSDSEKEKLFDSAKNLYQQLGAKHYLKSDFVLNPKGTLYLLNLDSTPNLKPDSHFSQVCIAVGAKPQNIVEHMIEKLY